MEEQTDEIALYVHIPFCDYKCTFCDFATYTGQAHRQRAYVDALLRELELRVHAQPIVSFSTVFFGGGTPSVLAAGEVQRILEAADRAVGIRADAEITLESNPDTLTLDHCRALRAAGVNRISIGVQSLDQRVLDAVNRRHTAAQAMQALAVARAAGFAGVSADLMFGLPGQQAADWRETLATVLRAGPDHLSAYGLIVEPRTVLWHQVQRGAIAVPDEDEAADMYDHACSVLDANGYVHYEISNWARPAHQSRHNLTYWHHRPYLGLGVSAHSYLQGCRFANVRGLQGYLTRIAQGLLPTAHATPIDDNRARADAIMLGLRLTEGIYIPSFDARFGGNLLRDHAETIDRLTGYGLIEVADQNLRLTPRAYLVANQVWQAFI
jgi:oxygen-independent coproporphyrinogen-3 oxidase